MVLTVEKGFHRRAQNAGWTRWRCGPAIDGRGGVGVDQRGRCGAGDAPPGPQGPWGATSVTTKGVTPAILFS